MISIEVAAKQLSDKLAHQALQVEARSATQSRPEGRFAALKRYAQLLLKGQDALKK